MENSIGPYSDSFRFNIGDNSGGFVERVKTRIVNGNAVNPPFKYHNIVSLQYNGAHACGGTLLTDNCVVTAAHCTTEPGSEWLWTANLHRHNLNKTSEQENGSSYRVKKFIDYPYYNKAKKLNDITVWKLDNKKSSKVYRTYFDWSDTIDTDYSMVKVMGWGVTKYKGQISQILQEIDIPIYPKDLCEKNYLSFKDKYPFDKETQFCGGDLDGGKDACTGDSGGPLFQIDDEGQMILQGLVSWGDNCGKPGRPGIYTKLIHYLDWVLGECQRND
ncbi:trypsin-like serine protease [Conidiobolus coronatus NRRL 28638]|uniref:Trypsin-like serine protease n=1 Tax=Conidiobolus coronatus (strain ATCC 28846 / CBS 209.66 / NRRL 28638) TaxID=796925 RepID=A0A137NU02_CONC2|nr:trypsin-like serine protease [Conidiobolus coronatus NRRL 28638]|eukprot:KXN66273.1 trypsin-like serine protease [Conidiobolus coronatus NRRL 28638]